MDISLALGGGGSRGYAHVGVIRCLENYGFRIKAVAGTSAGGIVAVGHAAGMTADELESAFSKVNQSKLFIRAPDEGPGMLGLSGAARLFGGYFGERTFADLSIPCAVVAVDIKTCREVILNQGRLVDAILATIAVPGVFPPKQFGDSQLVDGAVLNPVPVTVARSLAPGLPVVAVVLELLTDQPSSYTGIPLPVPVPAGLVTRLTRTRVAQAFNIFLQSVDIGSRMLAELRLLADDPDVIIRPDVGEVGMLDNVDVHEIVKRGEKAAEASLPRLRRATAWPNRLRHRMLIRR